MTGRVERKAAPTPGREPPRQEPPRQEPPRQENPRQENPRQDNYSQDNYRREGYRKETTTRRSGIKDDRVELQKLLDVIVEGDTIVTTEVSRLTSAYSA